MTWSLPSSLVVRWRVFWRWVLTYVLLASALSPDSPSPLERVSTMPPTVGLMVAWMATWPEVGELMVTEQRSEERRVGKERRTRRAVAPLLMVRLKVTSTPLVTTRPLPSPLSVLTVAVMTWSLPSSLVFVRWMIWTSYEIVLLLEFGRVLFRSSPVERVSTMPPTVGLMVAWMATWPEVGELMVTEQ